MKKIIIGITVAALALAGCSSGGADDSDAIDAATESCTTLAMASMDGYTDAKHSNVQTEKGSLGFYVVDGQMDGDMPGGEATTRYFKCDPAEGDDITVEWSKTPYRPTSGSTTTPAATTARATETTEAVRRMGMMDAKALSAAILKATSVDLTPSQAETLATSTCAALKSGATLRQVADKAAESAASWGDENARMVAVASIMEYCPQYMN